MRAALAAASASTSPSDASPQDEIGAACHVCGSSEPIFYKNGTVQHNPVVYPIFWGSNWNEPEAIRLREAMMKLYRGLSGFAWQGILTQYFDQTGYVLESDRRRTVHRRTHSRARRPGRGRRRPNLGTEVAEAISLQNKSAEEKKEVPWVRQHDAQFVVFTAPGTTYSSQFGSGFCAFHTEDGAGSSVTFEPGLIGKEDFGGCTGEDGTSWTTSHEYGESATDPYFGGWKGAGGNASEIGDVCEGRGFETLESADNLNGSVVQSLGDDHLASTCEVSDPSPPHDLAFSGRASGLGLFEATLNGSAYSENEETSYRFEFGPTTSYGESIPAGGAGADQDSRSKNCITPYPVFRRKVIPLSRRRDEQRRWDQLQRRSELHDQGRPADRRKREPHPRSRDG